MNSKTWEISSKRQPCGLQGLAAHGTAIGARRGGNAHRVSDAPADQQSRIQRMPSNKPLTLAFFRTQT